MPIHIFVPRWMNQNNTNAQNLNAKAMLSRFSDPRARWSTIGNDKLDEAVSKNGIRTVPVSKSRQWELDLVLAYQARFDAIFYPGVQWPDEAGLKIRRFSRRRIPVIATIEGIIADSEALQKISDLMGHRVFSQSTVRRVIERLRWMYTAADHIIAISPALSQATRLLYGDKVSYLPLGVESNIFHSVGRKEPQRCRVVGCATVKDVKRPQLFLHLAAFHKEADFVWFGNGKLREALIAEAKGMGLDNLAFPGAVQPGVLAEELRRSSIFVLPSYAEGVPKVTQEAAACGLPVVIYGFYDAHTVIHERNGLVAWSDEEMSDHVGRLIEDPELRRRMGAQGAEMAKSWDWNVVAPQWEELVVRLAMAKG